MAIVGLKNVHYALLTADTDSTLTYGTPKPLAPAISASVNTEVATEVQYGDDMAQESASSISATTLELELTDIPTDVLAEILGVTKDANGVLNFTSDYNAPYLALLFEGTKSNGGKRMVALLKGKFVIPESAFETKGDGVTFQSQSITGTFVSRTRDGKFKYQVDSDDTGVTTSVITNWYTAVYNGV